jgi:ubiquinone/menaquinone biosynthesis C-methylase UbiE
MRPKFVLQKGFVPIEEYLQMTVDTYNEIAENYVETTKAIRPSLEFDKFCNAVKPGGTILDAGCAWGRDSQAFFERGFSVVGIDLSTKLLELARRFSPNCSFVQADVRNTPFPDSHFDGIWCVATLLHLKRSEVSVALTEFKRVLSKGAFCFIQVKRGKGEEIVGQKFSQGKNRFFTYFELEEMQDLCVSAGFHISEAYTYNEKERNGPDARDQGLVNILMYKG